MDGIMLYDELCKHHPELVERLAFITGDTLSPNLAEFLKRTGIPYLAKPFAPRQVTELVLQRAGLVPAQSPSAGVTSRRS
jgi:hypothetical protein